MLAYQAAPEYLPAPRATESTLTLSMLHVPRADIDRIRQQGWPLACAVSDDQVRIALPALKSADEPSAAFLANLYALGYTRWLADLMLWACAANVDTLLFDAAAEPNDRLLLFVG